jgi:hypothetical protein
MREHEAHVPRSWPVGFSQSAAVERKARLGQHRIERAFAAEWPAGHIGWMFDSRDEFEARATGFLAEGLRRREKLMYVVDDPRPSHWPAPLLESGRLVVASIAEVYGPSRLVDSRSQLKTFEEALAEARRDGHTGIRVAADNTSLLAGAERLRSWLEWERVAQVFMDENPVTGLCGFDRTRSDPEGLRAMADLHAVSPPFVRAR